MVQGDGLVKTSLEVIGDMGTDVIASLVALSGLVVLSAFYSGAETALIGSQRVKLNMLSDLGNHGARRALALLRQPGELLATILVGNNLVNVTATAVATSLIGPIYASVVFTLVLLIFGELVPKTLAASAPERYACQLAGPVNLFRLLFKPIVEGATAVTNILLWPIWSGRRRGEHHLSRQELMSAIRLGARDGALEPAETRITREVLLLKDTRVGQIMIPLSEVDSIQESASYEEVLEEVTRSGNTRYPVIRKDPGDMVGMLHIKDLMVHPEGARENWRQYVRPLIFCQETLEADELLRDMQIQRHHMAVVERDAQTVGIVTMEDVLEEIVGEIEDEHDDEHGERIREVSQGRYVVRGDAEVDDLCKVINVDLGHVDQSIKLSEWFEKRCQACGGPVRRMKVGNVRVIHRGSGRYEILVRGPTNTAAAQPEEEVSE